MFDELRISTAEISDLSLLKIISMTMLLFLDQLLIANPSV
jgi:hypothetical protein